MRLRTHLAAVGLAALVPVLGFSALVVRQNAQLQLEATERGMRDTAHAVARTVDKELESAITTLQALAESEHLDPLALASFHALSGRVARSQGWADILLFDVDGRALMQASLPLTTPLPPSGRQAAHRRGAKHRPAGGIGPLRRGDRQERGGGVRPWCAAAVPYVLTAGLLASNFGELLRAQSFAAESVAVIQDRQHVIVARTQGEAELVGQRVANPSPGREGWVRSRLREGTEVYVAFVTAPLSGWRIVLTTPVATVEGPLRRGAWQMLAGAAAALVLAGALAYIVGRRIERAVGALVASPRGGAGRRRRARSAPGSARSTPSPSSSAAAAALARTGRWSQRCGSIERGPSPRWPMR